jgi:hypothetical protein
MRSLREINIPATVKSIGDSAFQDATSLSSITIPDGVTTIGESAFYGATSITSFIMPASVRLIGDNSFQQMREEISMPLNAISNLSWIDRLYRTQMVG